MIKESSEKQKNDIQKNSETENILKQVNNKLKETKQELKRKEDKIVE